LPLSQDEFYGLIKIGEDKLALVTWNLADKKTNQYIWENPPTDALRFLEEPVLKFSQSQYILTIQTPVGCITLVGFHAEDGKVMENWRRHFSDLHLLVCFNEMFGQNMVFYKLGPSMVQIASIWSTCKER